MEILQVRNIGEIKEVTVKYKFLFLNFTVRYRKVNGVIMRYTKGKYKDIGIVEHTNVYHYFKIDKLN